MKVGFPNYAFSETHELTVAGATVETGALANLRRSQGDQRVRLQADPAPSPLYVAISDTPPESAGRTVQVIALIDIKVEATGLDEVIFYVTATGSSGSVATAPVTVPQMPDGFPRHLIAILDSPVTDCDEVEVIFEGLPTPPGTAPRSMTITAGALWVGPVSLLQEQGVALSTGDAIEIEPAGTNQRSPGGQDYGDPGVNCRRHSGSSIWLEQAAVFGDGSGGPDLQALLMAAGTSNTILWLPDTSTPHMLHRTAIYGQFTSLGRINRQQGKWRWDGWAVRESR